MFNWLKQAAGAVGNAFNQGASFVARPYQQTFNQVSRGADDARRRLLEQQRAAAQAAQQARQQAQQQAQVNAQRLQQAVPKLNMGAAMSALGKVGMAANPVNQFKNQAEIFNRQVSKPASGVVNTFLPNTKRLAFTMADLGARSNAVGAQLQAPLVKPFLNNQQRQRLDANVKSAYLQADQYKKQGLDPTGRIGRGDTREFAKVMATGGVGAGLEIAPVVTGAAATAPLKAVLLKGGTLSAGGNLAYSALQGGYSGNKSAKDKAVQAGVDIVGGYGGEALGFAGSKLLPKLLSSATSKATSKSAPQVAKNLADKGRLLSEGYTNVKVAKIGNVAQSTPSPAINQNAAKQALIHPEDQRVMNDLVAMNNGSYRPDAKTAHELELASSRIMEHYNLVHPDGVPVKDINGLAQTFQNVLETTDVPGRKAIKVPQFNQDAPQANPEALLKKAGYKLNKDGDWIDPKGKPADIGEMQQVIQPPKLTQDENLIRQGKMKYAQAEADTQRIGSPIYETAPLPNKPTVKELNRGTIETVKGSPNTKAGLRKALENQPYEQLPNEASMSQAVKVINKNPQAALNEVLSNKPRTTQLNAQGLILAEKAQQRGDFETAQQIFKAMSPGNTQQGQAIQILSVWSKTKPEGVVKYAQKLTDDANNILITEGKNPSITLSAEQASKFRKMAQAIEKMPEGKDKLIATQKMLNEIHQTIPATIGEKLSTAMYYAQLLNPKTAIRNIVGNLGFAGQETLKDAVGAPIDATLTGLRRLAGQDAKRSVYLPNPIKQLKWGYQGAKEAMKEAKAGVNLSGLEGQLQIGNKQPAFRGKAGGLLSKAMQTELSVPDRAFYTARYQQTLHNLMKAEKVTKPTQEMLERADYAGKYATFQDDSRAAQAFVAFKKGLNKVAGTKDETFGLGNFVINYPKTPGNIIARGLDYSPVGFVKSTMEMAKPLFRKGPFDQQKFVESFSRATVGTGGLLGTGALLNQVGIITGKPSKDKDVNAQDKATGLGAYRINVSALKRFVTSGFNPESGKLQDNDQLISYDWFQPAAIGLSMGANINETRASDKGAVGKLVGVLGTGGASLAGGIETITNQPLVQGLTKFTGNGGGLTQGMLATAMGIPASFIPTVLNQVNQLMDNTARNTYDPNVAQQGLNMVKAKIPGLASTLPAQIGADGTSNERYQDKGNNIFNVMFNPAFTGKYQANDVQKEITRLENSTGQTSQYPNIIKNTQTVNGKDVQLSAQQVTDMQRLQGSLTQDAYSRIMSDPNYNKLSDTDKVKKLQSIITEANQIARVKVLGDAVDKETEKSVKKGIQAGQVQYSTKPTGSKDTPTNPQERYQAALDAYNEKKGNNEISDIGEVSAQKSLKKLKVEANFSQDTNDLYGLSNKEIDGYLTSKPNSGALWNQLLALDDSLVAQGFSSKFRDKYGKLKNMNADKYGSKKGGKGKLKIAKSKQPKFKSVRIARGTAPKISKTPRLKLRSYT